VGVFFPKKNKNGLRAKFKRSKAILSLWTETIAVEFKPFKNVFF
jgi:hypothetical protein